MRNTKHLRAILLVAVLAVWGGVFLQVIHLTSADSHADETSGSVLTKPVEATERYSYMKDVRDPFTVVVRRPKRAPRASGRGRLDARPWTPPPFFLDGIVVNGRRKIAVLRGEKGNITFLSEGDTLSGMKIRKIWKDSVFYSFSGKSATWRVR